MLKPILDTSHELASPSPQPSRWAHDIICPEMTVKQIHEIIEAFAKTAKLCMDAGVDGVEVHAVHEGYLLDQFAIEFFSRASCALTSASIFSIQTRICFLSRAKISVCRIC